MIEDFKLDLLFFYRKLKKLIAIELKIGKFKAAYKGQMELYLRWLEKHEMEEGENHIVQGENPILYHFLTDRVSPTDQNTSYFGFDRSGE